MPPVDFKRMKVIMVSFSTIPSLVMFNIIIASLASFSRWSSQNQPALDTRRLNDLTLTAGCKPLRATSRKGGDGENGAEVPSEI